MIFQSLIISNRTVLYFFENISKNKAARGGRNFGLIEGPAEPYPLSNHKNFDLNLAHSYDGDMLKISKRYLKLFLNNHQFTKQFWMP